MSTKKKPHQLKAPVPTTHLRRCHVCNALNEQDGEDVKACTTCGKHLAPFYFFNDQEVAPHTDFALRPDRMDGKVRPILGFTAYW